MNAKINIFLPLVLLAISSGCVPVGQRLLTIRVEQAGQTIAEGLYGVPDSTAVDDMWSIIDRVPFQLIDEPLNSKPGDSLPIDGNVRVIIFHAKNQLADSDVSSLSLTKDPVDSCWRISTEQVDRVRDAANPSP